MLDAAAGFPAGQAIRALRVFLLVSAGLAGSIVATAACAQIYKWVDDKGVTHYSDQAPAGGKAARKPVIVSDRLSVYTPSPVLVAVSYPSTDPALNNRIDLLERQLQAERQARDSMASAEAGAALAVYQRCLADRRVDCDAYGGFYPPYAPPVVVLPIRHRRLPFIANSALTGVTAGNVVGLGIIPGNFNGPGAITAGNLVSFRPNIVNRGARGSSSFALR